MGPVIVGQFPDASLDLVRRAVRATRMEATVFPDAAQARLQLSNPRTEVPRCILVDRAIEDLPAFIVWVRGQARLFAVPIIVLVPVLDETGYAEPHVQGADDVVLMTDFEGTARRVRALAGVDPEARPAIVEGRAVVAHPELARRRILGRVVRQAGFDVAFAADAGELLAVCASGDTPRFVVLAQRLPPAGAVAAIAGFRGAMGLGRVPCVVLAKEDDVPLVWSEAEGMPSLAISSDAAPAHNLLFLANELFQPGARNQRAGPRILFGGLCSFRSAGDLKPKYGLTYNLSREGLYVRTLDGPQTGDQLWFELRPPSLPRAVHLRGRAVWVCRYGSGSAAPPGFGMRIVGEMCPPGDLLAYERAYERMVEERPAFQ